MIHKTILAALASLSILCASPADSLTDSAAVYSPADSSVSADDSIHIEGVVLDSSTGEPLMVPVKIIIGSQPVTSSDAGEFAAVFADTTNLSVTVSAEGYGSFTKVLQFEKSNRFYFLTALLTVSKKSVPESSSDRFITKGIPWEITGSIVNAKFETAIEDTSARLYFDGKPVTVKEKEGRFKITTREGGTHTFMLQVKGYHTVYEPITLAESDKHRYFTVATTQEKHALVRREMVVTASKEPMHEVSGSAKIVLTRKEIQKTAASLADPMRVIQTLPGVASESDASARPVVRGGDVFETRLFLDGIPLIQPYHFGGARSIFNQSAVENLTIYKSGFPARYHDAQSAIITVDSREVITDTAVVLGDMNLMQYNAYVGVPLLKEKLGAYLQSQGSYVNAGFTAGLSVASRFGKENNYLFNIVKNITLPDYQDVGGGLVWKISDKLKLSLHESFNTDRFKFTNGYDQVTTTYRYDHVYVYHDTVGQNTYYFHKPTGNPSVDPKLIDTSFTVNVDMEPFSMDNYYYTSEAEARDSYERYTIVNHQPITFQDPRDENGSAFYGVGRQFDSYTQGKPFYKVDTLAVYKSRYNVLHGKLSWIRDKENHFDFKTAWQKRWWDLSFPDAFSEYIPQSKYDVKISQINAIADWTNTASSKHTLNAGIQLDGTLAKYDVYTPRAVHEVITRGNTNFGDFWGPVTGDTGITFDMSDQYEGYSTMLDRLLVSYKGKKNYLNGSLFFEDDWKVTDRWRLTSGTRCEFSTVDSTVSLSPRVTSNLFVNSKNEFTASAGLYTQNNYDIAVIALSELLQPEKVWHADLGWETAFSQDFKQKVNIYGKYYYDLTSERIEEKAKLDPNTILDELEQFVENNYPGAEFDSLDINEVYNAYLMAWSSRLLTSRYTNSGKGHAAGLEYLFEYAVKKYWHGWIGLTLQESQRQRHPGWRWHEFPSSRPFMVSWVNSYTLPRKYEIGVKYRYMMGMPYTETRMSSEIYVGPYNDKRLAPYQRFDIRIAKGFQTKHCKTHFYLEVWNAFNKPNAYAIDSKTKKFISGTFNVPVTSIFLGGDWEF